MLKMILKELSPLLTDTNFLAGDKTPWIKAPKNEVRDEFQVQPPNLSYTVTYVNSHEIKKYQDGTSSVLIKTKVILAYAPLKIR